MRNPSLVIFFCSVVHATLDQANLRQVHISPASLSAYNKYLDETCQTDHALKQYLEWEEHEFVTSLRKELLPETSDGDLRAYVRSSLIQYLPISPLLADPQRLRCREVKKAAKNATLTLTDTKDSGSAFMDFIIDVADRMTSGPPSIKKSDSYHFP